MTAPSAEYAEHFAKSYDADVPPNAIRTEIAMHLAAEEALDGSPIARVPRMISADVDRRTLIYEHVGARQLCLSDRPATFEAIGTVLAAVHSSQIHSPLAGDSHEASTGAHGDFWWGNIGVDASGRIVLYDFGPPPWDLEASLMWWADLAVFIGGICSWPIERHPLRAKRAVSALIRGYGLGSDNLDNRSDRSHAVGAARLDAERVLREQLTQGTTRQPRALRVIVIAARRIVIRHILASIDQ